MNCAQCYPSVKQVHSRNNSILQMSDFSVRLFFIDFFIYETKDVCVPYVHEIFCTGVTESDLRVKTVALTTLSGLKSSWSVCIDLEVFEWNLRALVEIRFRPFRSNLESLFYITSLYSFSTTEDFL